MTTKTSVSVHPNFWKDWKIIRKRFKGKEYVSLLTETNGYDDESLMDLIPHLKSIKNIVVNALADNIIDGVSYNYDRQPYLSLGWNIRKMRYAVDNRGKSGGLRIIFCTNSTNIIFVFIATKRDCADEVRLEKVFMPRIKDYLAK